jgi:hypothetical protein
VCLDATGKPIMNAGPLDERCASHRDLRPGERLTYHKIEYPGRRRIEQNGGGPGTSTRWDNIPVETIGRLGGVGAITISDNDSDGVFWTRPDSSDTIHGPDLVSETSVWRAFAVDHSGPYRNVSHHCTKKTTDPLAALDGNPQAALERGRFTGALRGSIDKLPTQYVNAREACPSFSGGGGDSQLRWSFETYRYSTGLAVDQGQTPPLLTLYMTKVTGVDDSHVETTFNTRELGQTLHQSWENLAHPDSKSKLDELLRKEKEIRSDHRCDRPDPKPPFRLDGFEQLKDADGPTNVWLAPDKVNKWALVSCRIATTIVPAHDPVAGDDPKIWRDVLAEMELSAALVGAPLPPRPSIRMLSVERAGEVTLVGSNFAEADNSVLFGERGCTANKLPSTPVAGTDRERRIVVPAVPDCARKDKDARVQVWTGRGMSVDDVTLDGWASP